MIISCVTTTQRAILSLQLISNKTTTRIYVLISLLLFKYGPYRSALRPTDEQPLIVYAMAASCWVLDVRAGCDGALAPLSYSDLLSRWPLNPGQRKTARLHWE